MYRKQAHSNLIAARRACLQGWWSSLARERKTGPRCAARGCSRGSSCLPPAPAVRPCSVLFHFFDDFFHSGDALFGGLCRGIDARLCGPRDDDGGHLADPAAPVRIRVVSCIQRIWIANDRVHRKRAYFLYAQHILWRDPDHLSAVLFFSSFPGPLNELFQIS